MTEAKIAILVAIRVMDILYATEQPLTKAALMSFVQFPASFVSPNKMFNLALATLIEAGKIREVEGGRYTRAL